MNPAEEQLLRLAEAALGIAQDAEQKPTIRLQTMQRFAALLRELQLPAEDDRADQDIGTRRAG